MSDVVPQNPPQSPARKQAGYTYAPGSQPLAGYVIKRGLGEGGFGEVYYALSDAGKEVALKVVRRHLDVELRGVSQCLNLKHANLIALYDVRVDADDNHWIVMEYVAGERLSDLLARHPRGLPVDEALAWLRGVAAGVEYLHQNGIVHRDLKPANLFREAGVVKIGDYGLSKFISASRRSGHTESVGTVHYMAPEITGGRYGKEIDVYSLGVILCEMLTGRVPFDGESIGEILMKHLTGEPDLAQLAEPYRGAIAAALQKNPADRPATVGEFVRLVEGNARHAAPQRTPPPLPNTAPRPVAPVHREPAPTTAFAPSSTLLFGWNQWKWHVGLTAIVVFILLLGTIWFQWTAEVERARFAAEQHAALALREASGGEPLPATLREPVVTPTWGLLSLAAVACLGLVGASVWAMRRTTLASPAGLVGARRLPSASVYFPPSWREIGVDVTGAWLVLAPLSAAVGRLLLLMIGDDWNLAHFVWTAVTLFTASALIVLTERWPGMAQRRHGRRMRYGLIGAATGLVAWLVFDYLHIGLPSDFSLSGVGTNSWPEAYVGDRPTWLAFAGYFGLTFFVVDWRGTVDRRRRKTWHFYVTAAAAFWAWLINLVFPFPQLWGILIVAGCTLTLPLVFPPYDRGDAPPGRNA